MKSKLLVVLACCSLVLLASPLLAEEGKEVAEAPIPAMFAPASCGTAAIGAPEPLFMATCCEVCTTNRYFCEGECPDRHPLPCINACNQAYNNCAAGCGGCP